MIDRNDELADEEISHEDRRQSPFAASLLEANAIRSTNRSGSCARFQSKALARLFTSNNNNNNERPHDNSNERIPQQTSCAGQLSGASQVIRQMSSTPEPAGACKARAEMSPVAQPEDEARGEPQDVRTQPTPAKQQVLNRRQLKRAGSGADDDCDDRDSTCRARGPKFVATTEDSKRLGKALPAADMIEHVKSDHQVSRDCDTPSKMREARLDLKIDVTEEEEEEEEREQAAKMDATDSSANNDDERNGTGSDSERRYRPQKYCAVCGDKAIACNFNAVTCESCKAFFRRNAFKEQRLRCLFENRCVIDRVTRRFCSKCRLLKCLQIGMKREWILTDEQKQIKRVKIMQNKQSRQQQQQQVSTTNMALTNNKVHPDEVSESRPSSGTSSSQGGGGQQQQFPLEPAPSPGSHQKQQQLEVRLVAGRQSVITRDVATSCPDESDLVNGQILPYCSLAHQCQYCSFRLVPPPTHHPHQHQQQQHQQQPPLQPSQQPHGQQLIPATPNANHHHYQHQLGFNHQQFHHQNHHQQQHQQQQHLQHNQPHHPPHHHYHYQQAGMQAASSVGYSQTAGHTQLGSSSQSTLANCYNFGPASGASGQLIVHQHHSEPAATATAAAMVHHQYHYHHPSSTSRNVIANATTSSTASRLIHAACTSDSSCCCLSSSSSATTSSQHIQTLSSSSSQHLRAPVPSLSGTTIISQTVLAPAQLTFPLDISNGATTPTTMASAASSGGDSEGGQMNMIEMMQSRVRPLNDLSPEQVCSNNQQATAHAATATPTPAVFVTDLSRVKNGAMTNCNTLERGQEVESDNETHLEVAGEGEATGAAVSGGDNDGQTTANGGGGPSTSNHCDKNTGSNNVAKTISEQVSSGPSELQVATVASTAANNNNPVVASTSGGSSTGGGGGCCSSRNFTWQYIGQPVTTSWSAKTNYVTWKGELFVEPAGSELEIQARVDKLEFNDGEREMIYEMIEATRVIFEPNDKAQNDSLLDDLVFFCDLSLRRLIKAVKRISAFRLLSMDDQILLLKNACFKILLLRSSVHYHDDREGWIDKSGATIPLSNIRMDKCKNYERHKELLEKLSAPLRRDRIIMAFMVLIILFDPTMSLKHSNSVSLDNIVYLCTLRKYLLGTQPEPLAKYERLIEALQLVNACNEEYNLFFSRKYQPEQITPLLIEIFDISVNDPVR